VGAAALEGRPGVISVEKGWQGFTEVNRVVYDPKIVTIEQMEEWLRGAGTFIRTLQRPVQNEK
jgi:hypothetical protein